MCAAASDVPSFGVYVRWKCLSLDASGLADPKVRRPGVAECVDRPVGVWSVGREGGRLGSDRDWFYAARRGGSGWLPRPQGRRINARVSLSVVLIFSVVGSCGDGDDNAFPGSASLGTVAADPAGTDFADATALSAASSVSSVALDGPTEAIVADWPLADPERPRDGCSLSSLAAATGKGQSSSWRSLTRT